MPNYYATTDEIDAKNNSYLTSTEKNSLWTVSNPLQMSELLSSRREKALGSICKNKKLSDDWNRPADINSVLYYSCPGDNPTIAIDRENKVSRLAYDRDYVYPSNIPLGLQI